MEHNSVMRPLMRLSDECGVKVETLPADPFGRIDIDAAQRAKEEEAMMEEASSSPPFLHDIID